MSNRLAGAASPYLRQHAHNPVDWYPWGAEALDRARAEDKPILLSVGYAACHWCHVMAHESFDDAALAAWLAERFVAIKVDREERPDLDAVYMTAVQAFTGGHGGWPMTVFLLPDGRPFLAGTYFPPVPRHGLPSFRQVCEHALEVYRHDPARRDELAARATERIEIGEAVPELRGEPPAVDWLARVLEAALEDFDPAHGGFGTRPKFPPHGTLAALLAHHHRTGSEDALRLVTATLDGMARGGVYDLLGGGFARYGVDEAWRVPHFEKMLFDNAQLVPLYVDGWRVTGRPAYARVAHETLRYLVRDLSHPEGGFFASEDADSEGVEGRFYVWTPAQLVEALGPEEGRRVAELLQVVPEGTFEHGTSVLRLRHPLEALAPADRDRLVAALPRLLAARDARVRPGVDDKVVTAWNALAIRALAVAGVGLGEPAYVARAVRCADFLLGHARPSGRLARVWAQGAPRGPGFLDDHAALALALVDLYEATLDPRWLREAVALAETTLDLFWDEPSGTCLYVGRDAERLVATPRRLVGGAEPAGNGTLAWALARLAVLCGRDDLGTLADRVLRAYAPYADRAPRAIGYEAVAWGWRTGPTREVGLVVPSGESPAPLLAEVHRRADPFRVVGCTGPGDDPSLLPWMDGRGALDGRATLYVCSTGTCRRPVTTPEAAREELAAAGG